MQSIKQAVGQKKGSKINLLNKFYSFKMLACKCEASAFLL